MKKSEIMGKSAAKIEKELQLEKRKNQFLKKREKKEEKPEPVSKR